MFISTNIKSKTSKKKIMKIYIFVIHAIPLQLLFLRNLEMCCSFKKYILNAYPFQGQNYYVRKTLKKFILAEYLNEFLKQKLGLTCFFSFVIILQIPGLRNIRFLIVQCQLGATAFYFTDSIIPYNTIKRITLSQFSYNFVYIIVL